MDIKTNWQYDDVVKPEDLNRIERNTRDLNETIEKESEKLNEELENKAPLTHTHEYLPLSGGTLTDNLHISGNGRGVHLWGENSTHYGFRTANSPTENFALINYLDEIWIYQYYRSSNTIAYASHLQPLSSGAFDNGASNRKWKSIWCSQSSINSTSDERLKEEIYPIADKYERLFELLEPVTYRFRNFEDDENHDRVHVGMIAQRVEKAMQEAGLSNEEFAGFLEDNVYPLKRNPYYKHSLDEVPEDMRNLVDVNSEYIDEYDTTQEPIDKVYALRYGEFISLNTHMIQKLMKRVADLEKLEQANLESIIKQAEQIKKLTALVEQMSAR